MLKTGKRLSLNLKICSVLEKILSYIMKNILNIVKYVEHIHINFFLCLVMFNAVISHCFNNKIHRHPETYPN